MAALALGPDGEMPQAELAEWEKVNRVLKRHGCSTVTVCGRDHLAGGVILDSQASEALRSAIRSLAEDTERRQNLIQGLIQSNNQLKEDLRLQRMRAGRQEQRANELQRLLEDVRAKIRDLEDHFIAKMRQQQEEMASLLQEKDNAYESCRRHQEKLQEQEESLTQLKKRLSQAAITEETQAANRRKAFLRLMNREPRDNILLDQQILDVIDDYERRVSRLQEEVRTNKFNDPELQKKSSDGSLDLDTRPNYKALVKSYQEQIKEARRRNEQLLREHEETRREMESRPTAKEFRLYKQQMRKMEKLLLQNNIRVRGIKQEKKHETSMDPICTDVKNLDLPPAECQRHLQAVCRELHVVDVKDLVPIAASTHRRAEACRNLHKILSDVHSVISGPRAPQLLYKHHSRSLGDGGVDPPDEADFAHLLPTVELWARQLLSLKALHRSIRKLGEKLLPDHALAAAQDGTDVHVEELLLLVDTMMEDVENREQDGGRISAHTLQALVSHFQNLFDVPSLGGVYPRMTEVYRKLGEVTNTMKNLRSILGLGDAAGTAAVVNAVWRLCRDAEEANGGKLRDVLGPLDVDSIINRLQEHEEFFPAFEGLVRELLDVLGITRLDEILPEVRRLKARGAC